MKNSSTAPSPYLIGAALGVLDTAAFLTAKKGLGVTTAFENTAALVGKHAAPGLTRVNKYLKARDEKPRIDWETFLVLGVAVGSFLASRKEGRPEKARYSPLWTENFGEGPGKRMSGAFLGGTLMMFGARMAKGCTSGHGLTGNMQFALSSLVFSPLMFASAILVGKALFSKGEKSHGK